MSAKKCPTVIFAAAVLSALSATNVSAGIPCNLLAGGIEACQEQIADATERLNQASGWLAQLEANAKTKPYLDPDDQSELQEAKNDVATKSRDLEDDKRYLDEMEYPKPKPPVPPTPEEQAAAEAAQAESAAREAEQERQRKLAAYNNKPTSLGVLFCRWGI
jgi:DNA repair exonuclease SbcCD ATPase subunit